ncbi:hypothetical protein [Rudaeicoccus suwonensis]|uniref:hypothetical protein n=1 Tax=Rudaeicoccus suwonensis TaxID=657409 RepID=UPI001FE3C155|nr:hypothetical protein [Rudaeicoccus suwonensis]
MSALPSPIVICRLATVHRGVPVPPLPDDVAVGEVLETGEVLGPLGWPVDIDGEAEDELGRLLAALLLLPPPQPATAMLAAATVAAIPASCAVRVFMTFSICSFR